MYESFWHLELPPFSLAPDVRFLLRARGHHGCLAALLAGLEGDRGVMVLTGEAGTGKTLLCRALAAEVPSHVRPVTVQNPYLSGVGLGRAIAGGLGAELTGATLGELMAALARHLVDEGARGRSALVIVDEAQHMSVEALEQIRILTTVDLPGAVLVHVLLAGQPALEDVLDQPELRQLDQRVGVRCRLRPLSARDTARYVEHRLRVAGLLGALPFTRAALDQVYRSSRGVPRVINLVADGALAHACASRAEAVTPAAVVEAAREIAAEPTRRRWSRALGVPLAAGAAVAGLVLLSLAAAGAYRLGATPGAWPWPLRATAAPVPPALDGLSVWIDRPAGTESGQTRPASNPTGGALTAPDAAGSPTGQRPGEAPKAQTGAATGATSTGQAAMVIPGAPPGASGASVSTLAPGSDAPPASPVADVRALGPLLARLLGRWGVPNAEAELASGAWPVTPAGAPDVAAVARRHRLAAIRLGELSPADLRAIGLPAIVDMREPGVVRPYLAVDVDGDAATLTSPSGEVARLSLAGFRASWTRQAWVVWKNADGLPAAGPAEAWTPAKLAAAAARLSDLGHAAPADPLARDDEAFRDAVRRFQAAVGLGADGVLGPITVVALSRAAGGRPGAAPAAAR